MADVQHSSAPVLGMLQNAAHAKDIVHQAHNVISTIDDQFSVLCEAAKLAERMNDAAKVKELRAQTQKLVEAHAALLLHTQGLEELKTSYQCTADATDFQAKLRPRAGAAKSAALATEMQERLKAFDRSVWNVHHADEAMPGEEDADIQIGGTQDALAPNARCPLSGKALLDLAEPVKDNQGYVYEKAAIVAYLNTKNGGNPLALVVSPSSGAAYKLTLAELAPAKNVIRQAKRKQAAATQEEFDDQEVID